MKKLLIVLLIALFSLTGCQGLKYQVRETTTSFQKKVTHIKHNHQKHKRERVLGRNYKNYYKGHN